MREVTHGAWAEANQKDLVAHVARVKEWLGGRGATGNDEPEPELAVGKVTRAFNLSPFERRLLVLCAAIELDSTVAAACAAANGDPSQPYPTFSLALATLPDAHWSALTPSAPLRKWRLVETLGSGPLTRAPLRIDERVLHYLAGVNELDAQLVPHVEPFRGDGELVPSHHELAHAVAAVFAAGGGTVAQLSGRVAASRQGIAALAASLCGVRLMIASAATLPVQAAELDTLARLWEREAALTGAVLLLECEADDAMRLETTRQFADRVQTPLIVGTRERKAVASRVRTFEVPVPSIDERHLVWTTILGDAVSRMDGHVDLLASQFPLSPTAIREAVASVDDPSDPEALWNACRAAARQRLDELALRIEAKATWDDLVLPPQQHAVLQDIANCVRFRTQVYERWGFGRRDWRGHGASALFHGPSGTGKTLAAEVLASELKLDLYAVDLSGVVSKYIGETEKNLRRIFEAGENAGAILLFDEADALFGKRSEVRDSHDRYANIEVGYLLQRMEAYRGVAILTTNSRGALDPAFLRRLRFAIEFPFPDAAQRAEIWRRVFPRELPTEALDPARLARLSVTGGNIRNIALGAAFLAARDRTPVRMAHLANAARSEYLKLDRTLADSEVASWS